ncbi:MAG: Type-1 restriction enzyme EcoKI specificity protein [Dehalococcoidia bacterium]|nr:Type-1 restriction enzyme EcoKI specificity protein [Chloroflexota bacterium]
MAEKYLLPDGWRWVRLGEVCEFLDHKRIPVNGEERQRRIAGKSRSELYPYYGANGQIGWIDSYIFNEDIVLLAEDGGFFGSHDKPITYRVSGKCWVNNHAHVLKPKPGVDVNWLHISLRIRPDVGDMVTGSTRPKLNQEIAAKIPISLPPLSEQYRIAAKVQELMQEVEHARTACEKQLEAAKALPAAYLREIFESEEVKKWERKMLGEVLSLIKNGIVAEQNFNGKGFRVSRIETISNGVIHSEKIGWVNLPVENLTDFKLYKGNILFSHINSVERLGNCAIYEDTPEALYHGMNLLRIKANEDILDSYFLLYWLRSDACKEYYITNARRAIGQASLNQKDIKQMPIRLPVLHMQQRIAAELKEKMTQVEKLHTSIEKQLEAVDALPQAILRKAFRGEL